MSAFEWGDLVAHPGDWLDGAGDENEIGLERNDRLDRSVEVICIVTGRAEAVRLC
mgnify:CR=1 FL=1